MKTFPINKEGYGSTHGCFYYSHVVPVFEWGKKIYMEYDGKLCAAIPLYVAYVNVKDKNGRSNVSDVVCFNIAGYGEKLIEVSVYKEGNTMSGGLGHGNGHMFKTIKDYELYIKGYKSEYIPDGISMTDIFMHFGFGRGFFEEHNCWYLELQGWFYDSRYNEVRKCPMNFKDLWIDEEGLHLTVIYETAWNSDFKAKAFKTREEALESGRRSIVEFGDDPEESEERDWIIDLPQSVVVKAKTLDEAKSKVNEAISNIVNK